MKTKVIVALAVVAVALSVAAQAGTTTISLPLQVDVRGCGGGPIHLSRQLLGVFTVAPNAGGGFLISSHFQPQGVTAVNLQTGTS
jgi:hypothetical protein